MNQANVFQVSTYHDWQEAENIVTISFGQRWYLAKHFTDTSNTGYASKSAIYSSCGFIPEHLQICEQGPSDLTQQRHPKQHCF